MRRSEIERKTAETDISLSLNLDGTGKSNVDTGCGFLNHMLTLFARHGRFDLDVTCHGDVDVDDHHSVEDISICLGMAFAEALGNGAGIRRYGHIILPMDETLILCAVDLSGRSHLEYGLEIPTEKVGTFDTELTEEFLIAFDVSLMKVRSISAAASGSSSEKAVRAEKSNVSCWGWFSLAGAV